MKILPCPFCGCDAKFGEVSAGPDLGGQFIECGNPACGCSTKLMFPAMEGVKDELAMIWNCRNGVQFDSEE